MKLILYEEGQSTITYCIWQNFRGGKLLWFSQFSLNYESFPVNHGLVDWQYKSTKMLQQKFYHGSFLPRNFCVYGMLHSMEALLY